MDTGSIDRNVEPLEGDENTADGDARFTVGEAGDRSPMRAAIREIQDSERSLLTLAILSGETEAVKWVNKVINDYSEDDGEVGLARWNGPS